MFSSGHQHRQLQLDVTPGHLKLHLRGGGFCLATTVIHPDGGGWVFRDNHQVTAIPGWKWSPGGEGDLKSLFASFV